jgi:hypothetical protein
LDFCEFLCLVPQEFGPVYVRKWTATYWKNVVHGCDPWRSGEFLYILSLKILPRICTKTGLRLRKWESLVLRWPMPDGTDENQNTWCPRPGSDKAPPRYKSEVLMPTPVCSVSAPVTRCIDCICTCHYAERADSTQSLNMYL